MVFETDGFLAVTGETKETAIGILNIIMGTCLMSDIQALSVREHEVADVEIDPDSLTIRSRHGPSLTTLRTMLSYPFSPCYSPLTYLRRSVPKDKLLEISSKAEKIYDFPDKAEQLRFLLEANTHILNSEYSQAFAIGWIILEKHIFSLWESFLDHRNVRGRRKDKLTQPAIWSTDYVLETLNLNGIVNPDEYRLLNDLKNKRNNFIHRGTMIGKKDAERCVDLSRSIVKISLSEFL